MKLLMCWVAFTNSMTNGRPEEWENSEKMIIKEDRCWAANSWEVAFYFTIPFFSFSFSFTKIYISLEFA